MAELVGGAIVGTAFAELWNVVKEAKDRIKGFEETLHDLNDTLLDLASMVKGIKQVNIKLKRRDQREVERLQSIMKKGADLVFKCDRLGKWDFINKFIYQKKLTELDNKITRFITKHIQLGTFLEVNLLHEKVNHLADQIQTLTSATTTTRCVRASTTSSFEDFIDPLDDDEDDDFRVPRCRRAALALAFLVLRLRIPALILLAFLLIVIGVGTVKVVFVTAFLLIVITRAATKKAIFATAALVGDGVSSVLENYSDSGVVMVINDVGRLETTIEQLEATMESLVPVLEEIGSSDLSESAESLRRMMEEGKKLVVESSAYIGSWNILKNSKYQKKMVELDHKLLKFQSLHLQTRLTNQDPHGHVMEGS
ncbi:uncharacterized protein LOC129299166 [Prosopis cineraria]|uniref:uncharacterized protein LOC129299166 n=1 Tax=Prosopis cineraria TaxID=364024 RepID=UPI00240F2435|nr:uncharacterized protein LOC129299166 [Prosopis cineraria]